MMMEQVETRKTGFQPVRMGYFLETIGATVYGFPDIHYRGIWRLHSAPEEYFIERGWEKDYDVWTAFSIAEEDRTLHTDLSVAQRFRKDFLREGFDLEIIYAEVAFIPEKLDAYPNSNYYSEQIEHECRYWASIQDKLKGPPDIANFLGHDISTFVPTFNSAIQTSDLHVFSPPILSSLNSSGLIDDLKNALHYLDQAMYAGHNVFAVTAIWEVPSE